MSAAASCSFTQRGEAFDADAGEDRQRDLGADARNLEQVAEQRALFLRAEAVEDVRVLAHHQVREQAHVAARRGQV